MAQQPLGLAGERPSAHASVVPAIEVTVRLIPFRVVTPTPDFAVLKTACRLPADDECSPKGVMGLQAQSWICVVMRGHRQKPFRQRARCEDPTGADVVLIDSVNRLEEPALIAMLFGKFAGPAVGFSYGRSDHPLGADRRHAQCQLQVYFQRVPFRGIGQRLQQGETTLQVRDRFDMSRMFRRVLPRLQPLRCGAFSVAGLGQMMGEKLGLTLDEVRKLLLQSRSRREIKEACKAAGTPSEDAGLAAKTEAS